MGVEPSSPEAIIRSFGRCATTATAMSSSVLIFYCLVSKVSTKHEAWMQTNLSLMHHQNTRGTLVNA